jgi:hypothetical protein
MFYRLFLIACFAIIGTNGLFAQQNQDKNTDGSAPNWSGPKTITYTKAAALVNSSKLTPFKWYYLEDKSIYLCAITPNQFMLQGYYIDSSINEVDYIEYDFDNAHIQLRCDKRGNRVGANYKVLNLEIVSIDPISVFKWGDDLVQDNVVRNAVLNITGLHGENYGILSNTITEHAEVTLSNADSLFFIKNDCSKSATVSIKGFTGNVFDNEFSAEITVVMDSASATVSDNNLSGAEKTFDISGAQGRFGGNNGIGNITCRGCGKNATILSANLYDGASIFADSMNTQINAIELHRGSELHMEGSDSAFSKSFLDFTAIVHAEGNKSRSEYNRFVGCQNGFGTHFYVSMGPYGLVSNSSFYSCETLTLKDNVIYNMQVYDNRNVGINTVLTNGFQVNGNVKFDVGGENLQIYNLRSFPDDEAAKLGGLSPLSLYINSNTGAITIMQSIIDPNSTKNKK